MEFFVAQAAGASYSDACNAWRVSGARKVSLDQHVDGIAIAAK